MEAVKAIITGPQCLAHFNPKLKSMLLTDTSHIGLGYILIQTEDTHSSKPVHKLITCGSRFLSEAERNYAVVEWEWLAIQWAVQKCRLYLAGTDFEVITDHQPLISECVYTQSHAYMTKIPMTYHEAPTTNFRLF